MFSFRPVPSLVVLTLAALPASAQIRSGSDSSSGARYGVGWTMNATASVGRTSSLDWASLTTDQRVYDWGRYYEPGEINALAYSTSNGSYARLTVRVFGFIVFSQSSFGGRADWWLEPWHMAQGTQTASFHLLGHQYQATLVRNVRPSAKAEVQVASGRMQAYLEADMRTRHYARPGGHTVVNAYPKHHAFTNLDGIVWRNVAAAYHDVRSAYDPYAHEYYGRGATSGVTSWTAGSDHKWFLFPMGL